MNTRFFLISLSAAIILLSGCGSSGGGSSTETTVTVERGPVFNATVRDAKGQIARTTPNSNRYTFATEPAYPITVQGGQVDVNYNGIIDTDDIPLPVTLKTDRGLSVTAMTTFLSSLPATEKETLAGTIGVPVDELYALPSEANGVVVAANNAAFSALYKSSYDVTVNIEDAFLNTFEVLKQEEIAREEETSDNITDDELAEMEEQVNSSLGLSTLTEADIEAINDNLTNDNATDDNMTDDNNDNNTGGISGYDNMTGDDDSNDYDNVTGSAN